LTISPTIDARTSILSAIQADAAVTALIPASRLYPAKTPNNPTKPFGRYGADSVLPVRASCWEGGDVSGSYHIWVGVTASIPDPNTYAQNAMAAIADAIEGIDRCYVDRTLIIEDAEESDVWHGIVQFTFHAVEQV